MSKKLDKEMSDLTPSELKALDKQVRSFIKGNGQIGAGIFSKLIKKLKKNRKKIVKRAVNLGKKVAVKSIEKVTGCKNKRTDEPFNYKKLPNESKHQTFKSKDGCLYSAKWSGPGTRVLPKIAALYAKHNGNISAMIKSSDFVNPIDRVAMLHDINYLIAGDEEDTDKKNALIREADLHFIRKLTPMLKSDKFNVFIPLNAMKAKVVFEKAGGKVYSGDEPFTSDEQRTRAKALQSALRRGGAGKKKKGKYDNIIDAIRGTGGVISSPIDLQIAREKEDKERGVTKGKSLKIQESKVPDFTFIKDLAQGLTPGRAVKDIPGRKASVKKINLQTATQQEILDEIDRRLDEEKSGRGANTEKILNSFQSKHDGFRWVKGGSSAIKYWADKLGIDHDIKPKDEDYIVNLSNFVRSGKSPFYKFATENFKIFKNTSPTVTIKNVVENANGTDDLFSMHKIDFASEDNYLNPVQLLKIYKLDDDIFGEEAEAKYNEKINVLNEIIKKLKN